MAVSRCVGQKQGERITRLDFVHKNDRLVVMFGGATKKWMRTLASSRCRKHRAPVETSTLTFPPRAQLKVTMTTVEMRMNPDSDLYTQYPHPVAKLATRQLVNEHQGLTLKHSMYTHTHHANTNNQLVWPTWSNDQRRRRSGTASALPVLHVNQLKAVGRVSRQLLQAPAQRNCDHEESCKWPGTIDTRRPFLLE